MKVPRLLLLLEFLPLTIGWSGNKVQTIVGWIRVRPVFLWTDMASPFFQTNRIVLILVSVMIRKRYIELCYYVSIQAAIYIIMEIFKDAKRYDISQSEFHQSTLK